MAPPPTTGPLKDRVLALVQTLQCMLQPSGMACVYVLMYII